MIAIVSPSVSFLDSLEFLLADRYPNRRFRAFGDARAFVEASAPGTVTMVVDHHPPFVDCERFCHATRAICLNLVLLVNENLRPQELAYLQQYAADMILQKQSRQFVDDLMAALARHARPGEPELSSPPRAREHVGAAKSSS
ncbi:hypothetical protein K6V92_22075 [Cupriavidus respiraculi]|uniref:hypothetical protein n=1 Tax=Cupriavidus respiraculi TaxID=195930 RepID=UPI001C96B6A0|nr:hypothetical protein [Cupriavidus respiraculi]MBY4949296.1 hypothetical protein [Cupriavidus respiraculi]